MKALRAIGWEKGLRFIAGQWIEVVLKLAFFPQVRAVVLRGLGATVGNDVIIHSGTFINFYRGSFANLTIGEACFVGQECLVDLATRVILEDQATLAPRVTILTHMNVGYDSHPLQALYPSMEAPVCIGRGSFVGAGSILLPGSKIGAGSLIAAGSVVHGEIPSGVLAGGVPCKVIRALSSTVTATAGAAPSQRGEPHA